MFKKNIIALFVLILISTGISFSQEIYPINQDYSLNFKKNIYLKKYVCESVEIPIRFNTSEKPWVTGVQKDSCLLEFRENDVLILSDKYGKKKTWIGRKLTKENFLNVNEKDFNLAVNPLFNFNLKRTVGSIADNFLQNTRGLELKANIGEKVYFETSYYENQTDFVPYVNDYIKKYAIIPGNIRAKNFKTSSYDYGVAYGLLSYTPVKNKSGYSLNFQLGNGKNFFGDGYRSMLLSDFSAPYPFLKITGVYKRLKYSSMSNSFQNIFEGHVIPYDTIEWNAGYQKKTGTFHYLSYYAGNSFDISLFEGTLWQVVDSGGRKFNPDFFNPLILYHSAEFGLNGKNNTMLGLNILYKMFNKFHLYGQLALDDFRINRHSANNSFRDRYGIQIGAEGFDMFGIHDLNLQAEYNQAQPYMYANFSPSQSYTHYNQPLAHPLGANFREAIGILRYKYNKFFVHAQINLASYGIDKTGEDWGKNIFASDLNASQSGGNKIGQGVKAKMKYADFSISYLLNPATNMNIFIGGTYRSESSILKSQSDKFIYMGIRTSLLNEYFDF